jgi:hypothetical protein
MHLGNVMSGKPLQKARCLREIELFVAGLDTDEEAVCRGVRETVRVENWMMRLRQPVEREHPEHCGK